jgi:hypothetical protein
MGFGIVRAWIGDSGIFMSEIGSTADVLRPSRLALPDAPISRPAVEVAGTLLLSLSLLSVAVWNGFPIIFYDTGAYMLQGLGHLFIAERSPIYSAFLAGAGGATSLWLVAATQCLITGFTMMQFARAIRPQMSVYVLLGIGAVLCLTTGLPWYAGQIEPDCFVAIVPLSLYLLAFHGETLGSARKTLLVVAAALSIACHSSHVALAAGLLVALAALRFVPLDIPRPKLTAAVTSFGAAILSIYVANFVFTHQVFFSRSGPIFLEARIMEDGLIAPVLDADCPKAGYAICPYKDRLPARADTWLWMASQSPFKKVGGFEKRGPESSKLVHESLRRYPLDNAVVALQDALLQFFWFQTGDGIVPQEWVLNREFKVAIPRQLNAYDRAYQQEGEIWFLPVNIVHVPMAIFSLVALFWLLRRTARTRDWRGGVLPAFILLALIGNAAICGVFSGPHGRYQSRIMWLPAFAVVLVAWPELEAAWQRRRRLKTLTA